MPRTRIEAVDHPLLKVWLSELRDEATAPAEFRRLVDEITRQLLIEALRKLDIKARPVTSPLEATLGWAMKQPISLVPVLRAGLGMLPAAQQMLPQATTWHLGLFRDETTLEPVVYYNKLEATSLRGHDVILLDPMLATAGTAIAAAKILSQAGAARLRMLAIIAAPEGIARLQEACPTIELTVAAIDERLTGDKDSWPAGYILPGLGDAGDRQFGT
jgi:uracil phosphoribosyltransferase